MGTMVKLRIVKSNLLGMLILLCVYCGTALGNSATEELYPTDIKFQHILESRDIVLGETRAIFQDSLGFMWFGGWNGLYRYDGANFKPILLSTLENGVKTSVPLANIIKIFEDSRQLLWIGTTTGIAIYNQKKEQLIKLENQYEQRTEITLSTITDIAELPDGNILATSNNGIFIIDPATLRYISINQDPALPMSSDRPMHHIVTSIMFKDDHSIWLGTSFGLDKFDWKKRHFEHTKPDALSTETFNNEVRDIEPAPNNKLWLATANGLMLFDPESNTFKRYTNDPSNPDSLPSNNIWKLMKDAKGRLWIALDQGGLALYHAQDDRFISYKNSGSKSTSLASNIVRTVFEDSSGDIWVGLYPEGIDFFDQSSTAIAAYTHNAADPNSLSHSSVLAISEDSEGNLWLGTDGGGLNYFDRKKGKFTRYLSDPNNPNTIASNAVLSTFIDSEGILWVGHWEGGITRVDPKTLTFTRIPYNHPDNTPTESDKLNSGYVWAIYEDKKKNFWIGTHTGGLSLYDRKTLRFKHYWLDANDPSTIGSEWIWRIYEDSRNNLWVGTSNSLDLLDRESGKFTHYKPNPDDPSSISNAYALCIHEDKKGRLWVGTNGGLNLYDYNTRTFTHITKSQGLNSDSIRSIVEDENGLLWLGTANGVSSFEPDSGRIKNYARDGGRLVGGFNYGAGIYSKDKEIIFGGINGLRIYKPDQLKDNPVLPPIALTNLVIYSDPVQIDGPDKILDKAITYTNTITLDHTKSMFILEYAALNYRDSAKNEYAYQLEGFDRDWFFVGNQRSAKYTNLDPGIYNFRVKGSNNDGIWNEEGTSLRIIQLPPPWRTWWAYLLYAIALLGVIGWAIESQRRKRRQIEEQNRILEERVLMRTNELHKKNNAIQALLSNIQQGLFTIGVSGQIEREYSKHLEDIFETDNIANMAFDRLLFTSCNLNGDRINQITEAAKVIIGEPGANFEFNSHLFVSEYQCIHNDKAKILSLHWHPIIEGEVVEKLMVTVRDVTRLREMEQESRSQKRELTIIGQLLDVTTNTFKQFERSVRNYIEQNRNLISHASAYIDQTILSTLLRNMHTIKGNARTYHFSYLSDLAHELESHYSELRSADTPPIAKQSLLQDLCELEACLQEYANIYFTVLRRADTDSHAHSSSINHTLEAILKDIVASLPDIANSLAKPTPKVHVDAVGIVFTEDARSLLSDVFTHLFKNSLDHGIEMKEERMARGKSAFGNIYIKTTLQDSLLAIRIGDDGKGLNIQRLHQIGVEKGKWSADAKVSADEIATLIFESGVSTKQSVTTISGRGVGMDAVKQFIEAASGTITLNTRPLPTSSDHVVLDIVITLPDYYFALQV